MVNEGIPFSRVFVVGVNGEKLGVTDTRQAILLARSTQQDLVVISARVKPPVAKIMDYGRFKYNRKKKQKEVKLKQTVINNREVRLTPMIGDFDLQTKARHARKFLLHGDRVKVSLKFRGRELSRLDLGFKVLQRFYEVVADVARIDKKPSSTTKRFLDMYLVPDKQKIQIAKKGSVNAETKA